MIIMIMMAASVLGTGPLHSGPDHRGPVDHESDFKSSHESDKSVSAAEPAGNVT